jgi:hypothetical protein
MSGDGRILLSSANGQEIEDRAGVALILTDAHAKPIATGVMRHADAAAVEQGGGCHCCRTPSDIVTVLRQLFLDRVRGEVTFDRVVVQAPRDLVEAAMRDPLVAARYRWIDETAAQ